MLPLSAKVLPAQFSPKHTKHLAPRWTKLFFQVGNCLPFPFLVFYVIKQKGKKAVHSRKQTLACGPKQVLGFAFPIYLETYRRL